MTKLKTFLLISSALLAVAACTPVQATRGNLVEDFRLAEIKPGVSTQTDVLAIMGSPTTQDPFDPQIWYYLGQKTEKKGILDPKVVEERVVRLTFDKTTGLVAEVMPLDNIRNDIPIAKRVTPTSGNEMTAVQQMMSNLGKFNKEKRASGTDMGQ